MRAPDLWLDPIPSNLREWAAEAFEAGDMSRFLHYAGNTHGLDLVLYNAGRLKTRGLLEVALVDAFTSTRTNNLHHYGWLTGAFKDVDRQRLRACGDPLPGAGPFTVYRGVAGRGAARIVRGFSWTADRDIAAWFANRFCDLPDPAVFEVTVEAEQVLVYLDEEGRGEREFLLLPSDLPKRPKRVLTGDPLAEAAERETRKRALRKRAFLEELKVEARGVTR